MDLVLCSPLTRAVETATLIFPGQVVQIQTQLREVGSAIPENQLRVLSQVLRDVHKSTGIEPTVEVLDLPPHERHTNATPKVVRRDRLQQWLQHWLANRPEETIAIVCHFHTIRALLRNPYDVRAVQVAPENCVPLVGTLVDGRIELVVDEEGSGQGVDAE